jgi:hypothetical protein
MKSRRARISFRIWWAMVCWRALSGVSSAARWANQRCASTTLVRVTSMICLSATVTARDSGLRRAPLQDGQGLAAM